MPTVTQTLSPSVTEAIQTFLAARPHNDPFLVARWNPQLETQINVAAGDGEPVAGKRNTWTDGTDTWWNIRIPRGAASDPTWHDYTLRWPLDKHVEAIGCTGWNYAKRVSQWVGFDFDAITGHAVGVGITAAELDRVRDAAQALPWVEVRRSTGGRGLHLYVLLDDVPTQNHTEHAAIGRAVLGLMTSEAGFDFGAQIDACGGNMWVWHRKATPENQGLAIIKPAARRLGVNDLPINWRDHIDVVSRRRAKIRLAAVTDDALDPFELLTSSRKLIPLDDTHKRIITALGETGHTAVWIPDYHLLQTHTYALARIHQQLNMRGIFQTTSAGTDPGTPNCFLFPLPDGAWKVFRFSCGIREAATWEQDGRDWTQCTFNRVPDLDVAARAFGGAEMSAGGFSFPETAAALNALSATGNAVDIPPQLAGREVQLKPTKDGRLDVLVKRFKDEQAPGPGWAAKRGGWWEHIISTRFADVQDDMLDADNLIRVLVTPDGQNAGNYFHSDAHTWDCHPFSYSKAFLRSVGYDTQQAEAVIGDAVRRRWVKVALPFQPEFPGGRSWNMGAAQFRFPPAERTEDAAHPHWDMILDHIGQTLTPTLRDLPWARAANIRTGADYLRAIFAAIVREPFEPTPYLFVYGPENSGKSILWEAFELLVTRGVVKADRALTNQSDFNGELAGAVVCVIEEKDISKTPGAKNKLKDYVTSPTLSIRRMRTDAFTQPNHTHWFQFANDEPACPVFPGDTRISVLYVPPLPAGAEIPKSILLHKLTAEGPAFLRTLMDLQLPPMLGRLRVPVVETAFKRAMQDNNRSAVERFITEECIPATAGKIRFAEFFERFAAWLAPEERYQWSKQKTSKAMPVQHAPRAGAHNVLYVRGLEQKHADIQASTSDRTGELYAAAVIS